MPHIFSIGKPGRPPLIRLEGVTAGYGRSAIPVLPDINLTVYRGDFMAITGPNGGGKTTLLRVLLKLLKPSSGTVTYYADGKPAKRLRIGYLPQKSNIDTRFPITVEETIASGLIRSLICRPTDADRRLVEEIMELTGTLPFRDRSIGELSGGQLQRTLLGRALISSPELLVLDEPLSYVDKNFERQIYGIIENVARTATVILVSHEMSVISGMADRHIIVDRGIHPCHSLHHYIPSETRSSDFKGYENSEEQK